jgi:hypothetical protein
MSQRNIEYRQRRARAQLRALKSGQASRTPAPQPHFMVGIVKSARTASGSGQRWVTVFNRV